MKRLVRSLSGRLSYGPKWHNTSEGTNEIERDAAPESGDGRRLAFVTSAGNTITITTSGFDAAAPPTMIGTDDVQPPISGQPKVQDNENQTWKGSRSDRKTMYRAALEDDWLAAEMLLARDPTLARCEITERGDRVLHVAAAMKHVKFVKKLVQRMSPSDLELLDGHGYTACCYAAMSGAVNIADVMMKINPDLGTARDKNSMTPLHKAALRGNKNMVSYFLKSTKVEDLPKEEWFDLLLVAVRTKLYDAAIEILGKNGSLATMANEEGTALHLLARQDVDTGNKRRMEILFGKGGWENDGTMQPDHFLLAQKLMAEIQRSEQASVLELIKKPSILHDAAKVGNVELITALTCTYPDLVCDTDNKGYTIFHISVMYRQRNVFNLIHQIEAMKDLIVMSQDENGNNILHLAAILNPLDRSKIVSESAFQMQRDLVWFKAVEAIVPPLCLEMRNKDGYRPKELFSKEHKSLLENSETWMKNTADSCMLVATIILTVVFAAAFTAPGGNKGETGIPVLIKTNWFTCFVIFEALALFGSTISIIMFWSIMTSSFQEDRFLNIIALLNAGLMGLLTSLIGAISAFMSAYFLVFVEERARLVKCVIILVYVILVPQILQQFTMLLWKTQLLQYFTRIPNSKYKLFRRQNITRRIIPAL